MKKKKQLTLSQMGKKLATDKLKGMYIHNPTLRKTERKAVKDYLKKQGKKATTKQIKAELTKRRNKAVRLASKQETKNIQYHHRFANTSNYAESYKNLQTSMGMKTEKQAIALHTNLRDSAITGLGSLKMFMTNSAKLIANLTEEQIMDMFIVKVDSPYANVLYGMWATKCVFINFQTMKMRFMLSINDIRFESPRFMAYRDFMTTRGWSDEEEESYGS